MIIDIRYHIASLVAVFLALGIGILVGGSVLSVDTLAARQEQIAERLENHLNELREENQAVRAELAVLEAELELQSRFQEDVLPYLAAGRLPGEQVALVELGEVPAEHNLEDLLQTAGAEVVSVTGIPDGLSAEGHEEELLQLGAWPESYRAQLSGLLAGAVARAIVEGPSPVVDYLMAEEMIAVSGEYGRPLDAVVLVAGVGDSETPLVRVLGFPMIDCFREYGLRVCGAEARETPVSGIKDFQAKLAATVDNVDTIPGKFALIQILAGRDGHYGVKDTAQRLVPLPD